MGLQPMYFIQEEWQENNVVPKQLSRESLYLYCLG